jgi:protein phosphatase
MANEITVPKRALVVLSGPSAAGKSTWARRHFTSAQVISSDRCRQMVSDDYNWRQPAVSDAAFDLLYLWVEQRLRLNCLAVADSTALMAGTRRRLLRIARRHHSPAILVTFDCDWETCLSRDEDRAEPVGRRVLRGQFRLFANQRSRFDEEGWDRIISIDHWAQEHTPVRLVPLGHERPEDAGPFDIIGDVHGWREELEVLLDRLGWQPDEHGLPEHPEGRRLIFLGDLGCGGPDTVGVWLLALRLAHAGRAEILVGDHDVRFARLLSGKPIALDRGLDRVAVEIQAQPPATLTRLRRGVSQLMHEAPPHLLLDGGRLAVAHAALPDHMIGKDGKSVRDLCRHAEGPRDPDRGRWVREHQGPQLVIHGHAPTRTPRIINHTLNIDTGCVLGGCLTAQRWPERHLVQVPATAAHWGNAWTREKALEDNLSLESAIS